MKESDLYLPLKKFLESQGYEVKSEIQDCDVVAIRENETPVVVELKLTLNLDVVLQCIDRLSLTSKVYIGIPKDCKSFKKRRKQIIKLIKMLGLGLIIIDVNLKKLNVDIVVDPSKYKPREVKSKKERLLGEFEKRVGDPNLGGMQTRKGIFTSYRQRVLEIAKYLEKNGADKASNISKNLEEPKARDMMYKNFYGWFDRVSLGVYELSPKGKTEIKTWLKRS